MVRLFLVGSVFRHGVTGIWEAVGRWTGTALEVLHHRNPRSQKGTSWNQLWSNKLVESPSKEVWCYLQKTGIMRKLWREKKTQLNCFSIEKRLFLLWFIEVNPHSPLTFLSPEASLDGPEANWKRKQWLTKEFSWRPSSKERLLCLSTAPPSAADPGCTGRMEEFGLAAAHFWMRQFISCESSNPILCVQFIHNRNFIPEFRETRTLP